MRLALVLLLASCDRVESVEVEVAAWAHVPTSWVACVPRERVYQCEVRGLGDVMWLR